MISSIAHIIVGVADLQPVRELWCGRFGLEVVAERTGSDPALEKLWQLPDGGIAGQLLLRSPGQQTGWLHFVQFSCPGAPVRANAATTALCPKNIDINCTAMHERVAELSAAGFEFRSAISEYEIDGMTVREVQMPVHDDINVVLIEVPDWDMQMTGAGYAGVTSFVVTVSDTKTEGAFYASLFGHGQLLCHRITGPEIEAVVGLPPGAALNMRLCGDDDNLFGRIELVSYEGVTSDNLFPAARPPATGSLGARFQVADVGECCRRASTLGLQPTDHGVVELLTGPAHVVAMHTPAGFYVEVMQPV